jgi:hypothetical protein
LTICPLASSDMDIVAILLGLISFVILFALIYGIDRI